MRGRKNIPNPPIANAKGTPSARESRHRTDHEESQNLSAHRGSPRSDILPSASPVTFRCRPIRHLLASIRKDPKPELIKVEILMCVLVLRRTPRRGLLESDHPFAGITPSYVIG